MQQFIRVLLVTLRLMTIAAVLAALALAALWYPNRPPRDMRGLWASEGWGLVFDITQTRIRLLEVTPVSCLEWQSFPAHLGMTRRFAGYDLSVSGDTLTVGVDDLTSDIHATRLDDYPTPCLEGRPAGPMEVLDIFLTSFDQFYPNFAAYGVDWAARRQAAEARLPELESEEAFSDLLRTTLAGVADGGVTLITPSGDFTPRDPAAWDRDKRAFWDVTETYLRAPWARVDTGGILHGWLEDRDVAVLAIHHMEVAPNLGDTQVDEARRLRALMTEVYAGASGVIVDARFNAGGSDEVALAYAGLFSRARWLAGAKAAQIGPDTFAPAQEFYAEGFEGALEGPVVVLTSPETTGAGEVFVQALRELPNVTVLGEATQGALSDRLVRDLPNGWQFTLPHQRVTTVAGEDVAGVGLAPDVAMPLDVAAFEAGRDAQLERALAILAAN